MYDLARLKAETDIVEVARDLGLQPKKEGSSWKARCPAHADQGRPNLSLDQRKGAMCFRCGFQGSVVDLVAKVQGCAVGDAIRWLADRAGLSDGEPATRAGLGYARQGKPAGVYPKSGTPAAPEAAPLPATTVAPEVQLAALAALMGFAERYDEPGFRERADQDAPAMKAAAWLRDQKGIAFETLAEYGVCWLNDWEGAERELKARFGGETLQAVGLLTRKGELHFRRHRLLFPFWPMDEWRQEDRHTSPLYLQGRNVFATDKRDRFDNQSSPVPCLYNIEAVSLAREAGLPVFICEGVTDTLTLAQSGRLACGIVGVQGFKPAWAAHFEGLPVFLVFDPDEAGREASRKVAATFVAEGLPVPRVVALPSGKDVTDFFTGQASKKV